MSDREILIQLLSDPENQPHQFVEKYDELDEVLHTALIKPYKDTLLGANRRLNLALKHLKEIYKNEKNLVNSLILKQDIKKIERTIIKTDALITKKEN